MTENIKKLADSKFEKMLVIGYGNSLRSDDGAGCRVADIVASWGLLHVRSLSVHQLTPELAEPIAQSQLTIFIDACVDSNLSDIKVCNVADLAGDLAKLSLAGMGHQFDPRSLLLLVQQVYGKNPVAYLLLLPAVNLDFGEKLSDITCQGVEQAVDFVKTLCTKLV